MTEIFSILSALEAAPQLPAALATLVSVEGSSYRRPGARMLVHAGGRTGSISGGCLEDDLTLRARRVLESGVPEIATYDTMQDNDFVWGTGTGCHGLVKVLIEPIPAARPAWVGRLAGNLEARVPTTLAVGYGVGLGTRLADDPTAAPGEFREVLAPPPAVTIFGAGDDAQPLVRIARELGWHLTVVDSRPAYATRERFPAADRVWVATAEHLERHLVLDGHAFAVVMSHRFQEDKKVLRLLLGRPLAYLGILGSRPRTARLLEELAREGRPVVPELQGRLCAPVGLDLGGTTPEAIALSVVAEIQGALSGRLGAPLRDRAAPLHG